MATTCTPIPAVVQQHAEEAATLWNTRSFLVSAPHVKLHQLLRLDDRLAAHLDGLAVAGEYGSNVAAAALESPGPGETFTAAVRAIEDRDAIGLEKLLALVEAQPDGKAGVISAFGWVSASSLRGITKTLLESSNAFRRQVGLAACAMHQVDPGAAAAAALNDADVALRARALRAIADRGGVELLPACRNAMADDGSCAYEAARACALLGDRRAALAVLHDIASAPGSRRSRALGLALKLCAPAEAHALLKPLSQDPAGVRLLVRGIGIAGDPHYVLWLIKQMDDVKLARLAGDSFSFIAGLDIASPDFERQPPEDVEFGPNDDPDDDNVAMDEDEGLPWPDSQKIADWWEANKSRFTPGMRYFIGKPVTREHCIEVLKEGYQRQRIAAAEYLCLLEPGTKLFPTSAPAWRQQRWLAKMN